MTTINRNGNRWTINEILSLQREYELLEWTVQQIAEKHQRTVRAILFKLNSEGFIESWNDARGFDIQAYEESFNEKDEEFIFHETLYYDEDDDEEDDEDDDEDYVDDEDEDEEDEDEDDEDLEEDDEDYVDDEDEDDEDYEEDDEDDEEDDEEDEEDELEEKEKEEEYNVVQEIGLIVKKIFDSVIKKHTKQLTL